MTPLLFAALTIFGHFSAPIPTFKPPTTDPSGDIPLQTPTGWKIEKQPGTTLLTPGNVPAGKIYAVTVTPVDGRAGSLDEIFDSGNKMIAAVGTFKALVEPVQAQSDGGWDYKFTLGSVEKRGGSFLAEVMAVKQGDNGGVVVVLSDSAETMKMYADAFSAMIRSLGGSTAPAQDDANSGSVDLQYTVPAGWTESNVNGIPQLEKSGESLTHYHVTLLIFPTESLTSSLRESFLRHWRTYIASNYTTSIVPLPLMQRLASGYAFAFDADYGAKNKNGDTATAAFYLISKGGKAVPVMGIYSGVYEILDKELTNFFEGARIPGASSAKIPLYKASEIAGDWNKTSVSHAIYVTTSGSFAGDASIGTSASFNLNSDGSYRHMEMAIGQGAVNKDDDRGTWSVDDDTLVLSKGGRYSLLGFGSDPKVGRFLVMGNYRDTKTSLRFSNPRAAFQATWMMAK